MEKKRNEYGNLGNDTKGLQYMANKKALEELAGVKPVEQAKPVEAPPEPEPTDFEKRVKRFLND